MPILNNILSAIHDRKVKIKVMVLSEIYAFDVTLILTNTMTVVSAILEVIEDPIKLTL
jgi:hypothetical protein